MEKPFQLDKTYSTIKKKDKVKIIHTFEKVTSQASTSFQVNPKSPLSIIAEIKDDLNR